MKQIIFILVIMLIGIMFIVSSHARKQEQNVNEWEGTLGDGTPLSEERLSKILEEHKKWLDSKGKQGLKADLSDANLKNAKLTDVNLRFANLEEVDLSDANLEGANLMQANLRGATLEEVNLKEASIVLADLEQARFQPKQIESLLFIGVRGLSTIKFADPKVIADLRKTAKEYGHRDEERALTAALIKYRYSLLKKLPFEKILAKNLFYWPTDYGANPWKSLWLLTLSFVFFSCFYIITLVREGKDGIWKVWIVERIRKDIGEEKPSRLTFSGLVALRAGFYFSLLSTFNMGWRNLNVGNWISRMQRHEYTLKASGWARTISGFQSILSFYLLVLWLVAFFGRPFD